MLEYLLERFLYRLSVHPLGGQHFVLKGGLLLAQFGARRITRDIDILGRAFPGDEKEIINRIAQIAVTEIDDGVTFEPDTLATVPIRQDDEYHGLRLAMTATLSRARLKLQLDVSFGDPVTPAPALIEYPQSLADGSFALYGYPIATVIAEKLSTAIALGDLNTRDRTCVIPGRLPNAVQHRKSLPNRRIGKPDSLRPPRARDRVNRRPLTRVDRRIELGLKRGAQRVRQRGTDASYRFRHTVLAHMGSHRLAERIGLVPNDQGILVGQLLVISDQRSHAFCARQPARHAFGALEYDSAALGAQLSRPRPGGDQGAGQEDRPTVQQRYPGRALLPACWPV